jgi:glycerol-3-phosphate O-acyltransferase
MDQSHPSQPGALAPARGRLGRWIAKALQGTYHHFSCTAPGKIGFLAGLLMNMFYSGIKIDPGQLALLKGLPPEATIVYTGKYKSSFEFWFYFTRYRREKLRYPEIGLDYRFLIWQPVSRILRMLLAHGHYFLRHWKLLDPYRSGYLPQAMADGRTAFLSLVEKKGFHRRFVKAHADPVQHLIEIQKSLDRPIFLVPQLMIFGREPYRSIPSIVDIFLGSRENPRKIRKVMVLFKNPGNVFVEVSQPLNLRQFIESPEIRERDLEQQAMLLRQKLLRQINRHRQIITGPILKTQEELREQILTSERLQEFMEQYAAKRELPLYKVRKEADGYIDEIAAKYNNFVIRFGAIMVRWFLESMFEGVSVNRDALDRVKTMAQRGPVIFIPCHKSHIDYLILSYVLYHNNMPCPHIAAGKNLSFWPLGPFFRGGGAFFIRRSFRGAVLYSKVFSEYVCWLLTEGFNIEFFIEGGRSRTGKLILPKLGLLSIILNAYREGVCEDMIFAPIYIGYDRVLEENAYLHEIQGGQKEPENFWQVLKARKFLKKRFGRIYIKFNEPISIKDVLTRFETPFAEMSSKEQNILCRNLGFRIINAINAVTVVTPHALAASALLNASKERLTYQQLSEIIDTYLTYLSSQGVPLADTLLMDQTRAIENALDSFVGSKFIERIDAKQGDIEGETEFKIILQKRTALSYYQNSCIAFFIPAAITGLVILGKDAFQFSAVDLHSEYRFVQEFFKNEFAYDVDRTPEYFVRKTLKAFIDDAILMPHRSLPDTYQLTAAGYRKLRQFASFLKPFFESYWIALNSFMRPSKKELDKKDRLKKVQSLGGKMYKEKAVERIEALSKINYDNAVDYFNYHGIRNAEAEEKIQRYAEKVQHYLGHLPP